MKKMKKIIIILDGWGDNDSVLKRTKTPNMDKIAKLGTKGKMYPIKGIAPESDASQLSILGQSLRNYTGRGPLEALGWGIRLGRNELVARCNFARIHEGKITNIRSSIPSKQIIKKINRINKKIRLYPTMGYRAVIVMKNIRSMKNTHPGYLEYKNFSQARSYKMPFNKIKTRNKAVDDFIDNLEQITKNKTLLIRGAGAVPKMNNSMKKWNMLADAPVELGIAKITGMHVLKKAKNINSIVRQAIESRKNIYLQIKGPDSFSHAGNMKGKIHAIEQIDRALRLLIPIAEQRKAVVCITSDHATPCAKHVHTAGAVPLIIAPFNRKLRTIQGKDVMKLLG